MNIGALICTVILPHITINKSKYYRVLSKDVLGKDGMY